MQRRKRCDFVKLHIPNTVTHSQKKITTIGFPPGVSEVPKPHIELHSLWHLHQKENWPWCLALKASRAYVLEIQRAVGDLLLKGSLALSPTQTEQQF